MQKVLSWSLIVQFLLLPAGPISFADEATLETESTHFISISKNSEESAICPAPSYNNVETEEEEQAHCNVSLENSNPSTNSAALVSDAKKILSDDIDAPKLCSDEFYAKQKITSKDKKDFKDHLQQICYKQFKHHKKKFAKQLLKNGHIFRALTVLLKRKKKYAKVEKEGLGKESYHVESDSIEELNRLIAEEEKKIFETYKSQIDTNESGDMNFFGEDNGRILKPEYRYSMNGGASIGDMLIKTPGGNCKIEIDTPTIKEPEIEYKSLLPPVDLLDSYPDACSYMVSKDFTEKDAMKLMGVDQKSRGKYCSDRQKIDNNDHVKKGPDGKTSFDHLNNIASKMANAAEDNMTPKFTITVSRNLYNDNVDNLAEKRGEFMQKYIYKKFLESANPDALPKWGETLEAFKKVFVIEHPYYAEAKSGNFGPEPLAKSAKQPHELEKLEKSLKVRSDKYLNDNKEYSQKEINAKSQIEAIKREISARKSENAKLKIKLEKTTDLKLANDLAEKIKENHAILLQKMHDKKYKEYQIKEFSQMKTYSEKKAKEYDPTTNKNLLKDFYTKRPESPGDLFKKKSELGNKSAKEIWDSKLFNKFKMASVEGTFVGGTKVDADLEIDEFSPKIKYIVDKSFKATGFQCSYKMEEMRKKTTRKKLKWPKGHWWKRALMKPVIGITWAVATPFIGLAAIGRGIGKVFTKKSTCPNFSGRWHPYKKIYRKMNPRGHDGGFKIKTKAKRNSGKKVKGGKYDGYNPDIWPEAEEAFKNK